MTKAFAAALFGCKGPTLDAEEVAFFRATRPFGFSLFARNVENPSQVRALTASLREAAGHDAPVFVDQEGGRVQRLRAPHWREWTPALDMVDRVLALHGRSGAARAVWLRNRLIAAELRDCGIDGNYAPGLDIVYPETHAVLRNRCLGRDAGLVAELGLAAAAGLMAGGVLPVIKHMPGQGRAPLDSHLDLPFVAEPVNSLQATDFAPFKALAHLPLAMTAHVVYRDIDAENPATSSPAMLRVMRDDIGFKGLLMTDDLSMKALKGDLLHRARVCLNAGCDALLHCNGDLGEMRVVAQVAQSMTAAAQTRATAALAARGDPEVVDIPAMEAELSVLLGGNLHG